MTNFDYFEPTGNARLDANLRRHVEKLNMSEAARERARTSLEKLSESVTKLEKSIEEQKAILASQEKLLSQMKQEIEDNRELFYAVMEDINSLDLAVEGTSLVALRLALNEVSESIDWVK